MLVVDLSGLPSGNHLALYIIVFANRDATLTNTAVPSTHLLILVIPRQLCDNAGFDTTDMLNKLRQKHSTGFSSYWSVLEMMEACTDKEEAFRAGYLKTDQQFLKQAFRAG